MKKILIVVVVIIIIIFGIKGINFIRNQFNIKYANEETSWIENFYTNNARYPEESEFNNQFSKFKLKAGSVLYRAEHVSIEKNSAQNFLYSYKLSKRTSKAPGIAEHTFTGYTGRYFINNCSRSIPDYFFNQFSVETYANPDVWIYTDIYTGEVYLIYNNYVYPDKINEKIILLQGLIKPRIYSWRDHSIGMPDFDPDTVKDNIKYKNKIYITNGNNVYSYDWDGANLKLLNPEKIGQIPNSCTDLNFPKEKTITDSKFQENNANLKYDPNGPYPSPIIDKTNMINARGEVVDKFIDGTFKIVGTNEIFKYRERYDSYPSDLTDYNGNSVNDCVAKNCKIIYFIDQTNNLQGRTAIFNDKDNAAIGVINKVTLFSEGKEVPTSYTPSKLGDTATHSITFTQGGKSGQTTTYSEDLCIGHKGGGFYCNAPRYLKGDSVMFIHDPSRGVEYVNGSLFSGKITKAELGSYQYSMSLDTGEVFQVIQR